MSIRLTTQQNAAIDHVLQHRVTVIKASAGSGKSTTLVYAILRLLSEQFNAQQSSVEVAQPCHLDRFALITFTRNAASELRHKIAKKIEDQVRQTRGAEAHFWREQQERLSGAFIGTIHAFCRHLLTTYGYDVDIARELKMGDQQRMLSEAVESAIDCYGPQLVDLDHHPLFGASQSYFYRYQISKVVHHIYEKVIQLKLQARDVLQATAAFRQADPSHPQRVLFMKMVLHATERYHEAKASLAKVDTADLLEKTKSLVATPVIPLKIAKRYPFIFVDEFQDTDPDQKEVIDAIIPHLHRLLVVGDLKQAIYGFTGANSRLIDLLAQEQNVQFCPLTFSGRSTAEFIDKLNTLFAGIGVAQHGIDLSHLGLDPLNPLTQAVDLPVRAAGDPPEMVVLNTDHDESTSIVEYIQYLRQQTCNGVPIELGEIAILARTNQALFDIHRALVAAQIPAEINHKQSFYKSTEVLWVYRFLYALLEWPDQSALRYLGDSTSPFYTYAQRLGCQLDRIPLGEPNVISDDFAELMNDLKALSRRVGIPDLLMLIYERFNLLGQAPSPQVSMVSQQGQIPTKQIPLSSEARSYMRLIETARELFQQKNALTLHTFVRYLELMSATNQSKSDPLAESGQSANFVRLMTIHGAKGLQFPFVIISGMGRALTPYPKPKFYKANNNFIMFNNQGQLTGLECASFAPSRYPNCDFTNQDFVTRYNQLIAPALKQEEFRLLYVAVTRAKRQVAFSCIDLDLTIAAQNRTDPNYKLQDELKRHITALQLHPPPAAMTVPYILSTP